MNRKIKLNDQIIEYQINIKNIKRCYIRIISGKLIINAGIQFDNEMIENFIFKNKNLILKHINRYIPKANYINNGYVYLFDYKYQIIQKQTINLLADNKQIVIDNGNIQTQVEKYLKNKLFDYIVKQISNYLISIFDLYMPNVEIKKYKSRWGACFPKKNKVVFNFYLVHLDKSIIDYVIIHELCHFLQPNHSKAFYYEIEKRLPNYKILEKKLKETEI